MFHSNDFVAIHLQDITAAENFYTNIMKFRLLTRSEEHLEYDTGHFLLYVNRDLNTQPPALWIEIVEPSPEYLGMSQRCG